MTFHNFTMQSIQGEAVDFNQFKGRNCLAVNVASRCGLTPQYTGLQLLHERFEERGLTVMGFPCNQFKAQEPGSDEQICDFVQQRYSITFPMFTKIEVNGDGACELYRWLTESVSNPQGDPDIVWNFTKFLIDGDGKVVERFEPNITPEEIAVKLDSML